MAPPLNPHAQPYFFHHHHVQYFINYYNLPPLAPCFPPLPPPPPPPPLPVLLQNNSYFHQYPLFQYPIKLNLPNTNYNHKLFVDHGTSTGLNLEEAANKKEEDEEEELLVKREGGCTAVDNFNKSRLIKKKKHWNVKGQKYPCSSTSYYDDEFRFKDEEDAVSRNITTVMIKNIPNKLDKKQMLKLTDEHCLEVNKKLQADGDHASSAAFSEFDFLYLPIDFKTGCNKGYAFVNFTTPTAAYRFYQELHEKSWAYLGSNKVCDVKYARIQGLTELLGHFSKSFFNCSTVEYLPVHFTPNRDGFCVLTNQRYIGKHI